MNGKSSVKNGRIICIDRFRGFAVFAMIFFQLLERFESLGILARIASHNVSNGIVILPNMPLADIGAPGFFLVIALNYIPSLRRRTERDGEKAANMHFIMRYLAILGFGCCIKTIESVFGGASDIPTLVTMAGAVICLIIGLAILVCAPIKRAAKVGKTLRNVLTGVLAILGILNVLMSSYNIVNLFILGGKNFSRWGVLQAIGGAGLLALPFARLDKKLRTAAAAVMLGLFTVIHSIGDNMRLIDEDVQGGIIGILSWCAMLLAFTVIAELWYTDRSDRIEGKKANRFALSLAVTGALAVICFLAVFGVFGEVPARILILNKGSVSTGYTLVNLFISSAIFLFFSLTDGFSPKFRPLCWWGASPIIMFLLQYILSDIVCSVVPGFTDLSAVPALIYTLFVTVVITVIAWLLYRDKRAVRF